MACTCRSVSCPNCDTIIYPGSVISAHPVADAAAFHEGTADLGEDGAAHLGQEEIACPECKVPFWLKHERECVEGRLDSMGLPQHRRAGILHKLFGSA